MRELALGGDDEGAVNPVRKWGTVTPQYMIGGVFTPTSDVAAKGDYDERTVPLRIRERLPDVRLIACLRDPVERARSHHRMAVMVGRERRSFDDAVRELLRPDALERARREPQDGRDSMGYIAWGEYSRILAGYLDVFPREQLLVVFTEELRRAPVRLLSRIEEFVGVNADFEPDNLEKRYRVGAIERAFSWTSPSSWMSPSSPLSPQAVKRVIAGNSAARAAWHSMPAERQRRLARPYERLAAKTVIWNRRNPPNQVKANAEPSAETITRLREHYAHDSDQLAAVLGMLPPWQATGTVT
jgi:hypothetical protein